MSLLDRGSIGRYHDAMTGRTGQSAAQEAAILQMQAMQEARGELEGGFDKASGYYQPYVQPGLDAYGRMVSGATAEGYGANLDALQRSPAIQALMDARSRRVSNQLASTGLSRSGYGARALGDVDQETLMGLEQMLMGRTSGIAQQGYGAQQQLSGLDLSRAKAISDLIMGRSQAHASGILGMAEALSKGAQNQYTAIHNAGSSVMGMFGGGMGGGGDLQSNTPQQQSPYQMPANSYIQGGGQGLMGGTNWAQLYNQ